jgi:arylsulfatase A-like enzyme
MTQPNILFLFPDQWRGDWLKAAEGIPLKTPNLDKLRTCGTTFKRAWCPSPLCAPSRAALALGREYDQCGVINNSQPMPVEPPNIYKHLRHAGYRVAGVGKFDLDKPGRNWKLDGSSNLAAWGFTDGCDNEGKFDGTISYQKYNGPIGPYLKDLHDAGLADQYAGEHANNRESKGAYISCVPDDLYCDNWLSKKGMDIIRDFPVEQPWFMQVNFTGPHNPMAVTEKMAAPWRDINFHPPLHNDEPDFSDEDHQRNRRHYAAMIENIDRLIGEFIAVVEARGELDNTLIVFSSDHGEMLGDFNAWGKQLPHAPSVEVPLVIAGPGVKAGVESNALAGVLDLASTFLEYAKANPLPETESTSLEPLLCGQVNQVREYMYSGLNKWRAITDGKYKLVVWDDAPTELYDLINDPKELNNIAKDNKNIVEKLEQLI